jgi:hypothetical protein
MKVVVRPIGYTPLARHTWEFAVVQDDWCPPMPALTVGRARSKTDAVTIGLLKMADMQGRYVAEGWMDTEQVG